MEEKRREDQSEEADSSTLQENSQETPPVRKLKNFKLVPRSCQLADVGLFSTGSRSQKCADRVLLLSVAEGPLCCAAPRPELRPPARQRAVETDPAEPAAATNRAARPEGPV